MKKKVSLADDEMRCGLFLPAVVARSLACVTNTNTYEMHLQDFCLCVRECVLKSG